MVDVSSYNRPEPSLLDNVQKFQAVENNRLQISQQKLDQANQANSYMIRAMGSLGPNASKEDYFKAAQGAVDRGLVPQEHLEKFTNELRSAPNGTDFYKRFMSSAMDLEKQIQLHTGVRAEKNDNAVMYQGKEDVLTGGFKSATQAPIQLAPTQPIKLPGNRPGIVGPAGEPGFRPSVSAVSEPPMVAPAASPLPQPSRIGRTGNLARAVEPPSASAPTTGPTGDTVSHGTEFNNRFKAAFPNAVETGPGPLLEPGVKMFSADQASATAKATALKPLEEAYDLAKLVKTGAGTENLNRARDYLSNLGLIPQNEKSPNVIYAMLNKNLAQFVDKNGSRSDADLAIKESSNANAKTQVQPALLHMVQKIIGREKIEIARPGSFDNQDHSKYGEHASRFPSSQDERAYTIDKIPSDDARQLYIEMKNKAVNGKGAEKQEGIKFLKSLSNAKRLGLINGIN